GGFTIVDEIYQGLTYDEAPFSALSLGEDIIVINSFSKYFNMTGWRLGWLVVPENMVRAIEKLAQNLFICASSIAQHAGVA
ncbi:aminotransferase class I/II-fold pyridoxal phosphate-dependent enzyme, partial [Escherichia coli]|uniref:aminotransferase class I/II-fold pyridoxal phosphate-dependent enzyme n=2 Tax=Pseudomonadota TaxID=1224 RepID=UPI000CAC53A8